MATREELFTSISSLISSYRQGEIAPPNAAHVEEWISQFGDDVQLPILTELDSVLKSTYLKKESMVGFLSKLVQSSNIAGEDPCKHWRNVKFLRIQQGGSSQVEMLALFDEALQAHCGFTTAECGAEPESYLYLDDILFSGGRVKFDLCKWIREEAPAKAKVDVVMIAFHAYGQYYAKGQIEKAAREAGKSIEVNWWRLLTVEDRKYHTYSSDVLRPTAIPDDPATLEYVEAMVHKPNLRTPGNVGEKKFFSSNEGRQLLEQEFLKAGVRIRGMCPMLPAVARPLGHHGLETLGFGSMFVTYRNCPNNAPLVFWAGWPWYPLFSRKTN